ncbi:MAG: hybrid histidine kinase/response regulator HrmK [Calothrix sp. MO_192.B10]|nr:hybrid histidine kinase/response regulator HrmK [Calothrix sp. MO_192.B10]
MQQYSSLPERNPQVDEVPNLLATIQQLRAELWLERSLKQLQNCLSDRFASTLLPQKEVIISEAEIFQTFLDELQVALSASELVTFTRSCLAIALLQPKTAVATIAYLSNSSEEDLQDPWVGQIIVEQRKLSLKLSAEIKLQDLENLEQQVPQKAWRLPDSSFPFTAWLIVDTEMLLPGEEAQVDLATQLIPRLIKDAVQQCAQALEQLTQIQSLQQSCQHLEKFNQELERTNQLKNQFLANTSHEIRTPLSSILGFTQLLLAKGYDPTQERHQEYLNIILSSGKHLLALINDILDLSKIEADQLEVQWEKVNVPELCGNVLALVKEKASNKGLKLRQEIDDNVTTLVADPLRLKQMLLNLLFNALKFTSSGSVGLKVQLNGSFMNFTVWDTGTGIPKELQSQLFQPYCQIANAVANRGEGTGLGLVVTKQLAEIHGGWIEVESDVDRGSQFTIALPLIPAAALEQLPELTSQEETEQDKQAIDGSVFLSPASADILLLEDDLPNAQMIQTYLENDGYRVTLVKSAAEVWQVLTQIRPAVILMDIQLPDSNGLELVQQLRQHQQYREIPLIAQTAMAMKGDRETCLSAGVNEYISKPIDLSLLAKMIAKYSIPEKK